MPPTFYNLLSLLLRVDGVFGVRIDGVKSRPSVRLRLVTSRGPPNPSRSRIIVTVLGPPAPHLFPSMSIR